MNIVKRIKMEDYDHNMGILIDVQNPDDYIKNPTLGSINIYADKLLMNYKNILDPNKKYFIVCNKGHLSKRVVSVLSYYGYDVTQIIR